MRLGTRGVLAALPLALALALTGCGGDDGDDGNVASVNGAKGGGGAAASPSLKPGEMGVKFAQCMRQHGIPMEDPKPGGGIQLKVDKSIGKEKADKAQEACREFNPMANQAPGSDPKAEERGRKFAECMRKNGVEGFKDPEPGQRGIRITGEAADDPDMKKAQEACQGIFSKGGPGQ